MHLNALALIGVRSTLINRLAMNFKSIAEFLNEADDEDRSLRNKNDERKLVHLRV